MLLVCLLAVAIMTIHGSIAASVSLDTMTHSVAARATAAASELAQAGLVEARARLRGVPGLPGFIGDPLATLNLPSPTPNPLWSAYILTSSSWQFSRDPDYNATYTNYVPTTLSLTAASVAVNALQTSMPYWVKIRHKREYDAERAGHSPTSAHYLDNDGSTAVHTAASPGSIIYYGYASPSAVLPSSYTVPSVSSDPPIELVMAYGETTGQMRGLEIEVVREVGPPRPAALYSKGNISMSKPGIISGVDACGRQGDRAPIYYKTPATLSGSSVYAGSPATPQSGTLDIDLQKYVDTFKSGAVTLTADKDNQTYGSPSQYVTVYSNPGSPVNVNGLQLKNVTGYGTLVVNGDLILGKNVTWYGPIIASGLVTLKAPDDDDLPSLTIRGGIYANGIYASKQGYNIQFDSCEIAKAMGTQPLKTLRWRHRT